MATNTSTKTGDLSDTTVWDLGHVPIAGEDVVIASGHVVTWDAAADTRIPSTSGALNSLSGDGQFVIGAKTGALELYATTIPAGTIGADGFIKYSVTTADGLTIGSALLPTSITGCAAGGTSPHCINKTAANKPLTIYGNVTGGAVNGSYGLYWAGAGLLKIYGNVAGGAGGSGVYTIQAITNGSLLTGNITGGSANGKHAFYVSAANSFLAIDGILTGGSVAVAHGFYATAAGTFTLSATSTIIEGVGGLGFVGPPPTWTPNADAYMTFAGGNLAPEVAAGDLALGVENGTVTGTLVAGVTVNGVVCGAP